MREEGGNKVKYQGHKPSGSEKHSPLAALSILLEVSLGIKTIVSLIFVSHVDILVHSYQAIQSRSQGEGLYDFSMIPKVSPFC